MSCDSKTCTPQQSDVSWLPGLKSFIAIPNIVAAFRDIAFLRERQRQRRRLRDLDDRLLADIGLTRQQADIEAGKPFWL